MHGTMESHDPLEIGCTVVERQLFLPDGAVKSLESLQLALVCRYSTYRRRGNRAIIQTPSRLCFSIRRPAFRRRSVFRLYLLPYRVFHGAALLQKFTGILFGER